MNIFIGPTEISGIANNLKKGFLGIGISAETIFSQNHPFGYEKKTSNLWLVHIWQYIGLFRGRVSHRQLLLKVIVVIAHVSCSFLMLVWALARFEAFIFIYGQTITNTRAELILLRALGKKIFFLYVGSDARPPYIDGPQFPPSSTVDFEKVARLAKRSKRKLAMQEKYADACINSPASAQLHARPFINWFKTGIPKIWDEDELGNDCQKTGLIRILHSPSHPEAKGTQIILATIERLQAKGYPIELVKIEGMSHARVLQELVRCDFVVDQLYSDTPMAAFATEAAHFGKPAVVGGYFARSVKQCLSPQDIPPSLFIPPEELEQAIERLIVDVDFRLELGNRAREFVCRHWTPELVARRFLCLIEGSIPADWWCIPSEVRYVQGCGMPEDHAKTLVRGLIERYGKASLQLSDKPELEQAFVQFAGLDSERTQ
jgi:glycosyltransferase involved in cell wall biosynthesis